MSTFFIYYSITRNQSNKQIIKIFLSKWSIKQKSIDKYKNNLTKAKK